MWNKEAISVKNLSLWDENARFPDKYFNKTEKDLIEYLCSKKDFKIFELADAVVKEFDLPQVEKLIVYNLDGKKIVLEGNRRLVVYKLLINPNFAPDPKTKERFLELKKKINIGEDFEVECLVTEDKEQGFRYIERKHLHRNNEVPWGDNERAHHKTRIGKATQQEKLKVAITKLVRELDIPESMKDLVLGPGYVTNFWRIVDSDPARKKYGFSLDKKGNLKFSNKGFVKDLKVIILNVIKKSDFLGKDIDSRSLNKSEQKETYLKSINKKSHKIASNEIKKYKVFFEKNEPETKQAFTRSLPIPRGLFFESNVPYRLKGESSLRILYLELRDIDVEIFPNAAHDLLRSFLECGLLRFFKKNGEFSSIKKNDKHNPTLGEMLNHVINGKSKSITDVNLIETIKQIKVDWDKPYSLQRLNMVNHNENWVSSPKDVRSAWAKLESLIKLILNP